jgi:ferritin
MIPISDDLARELNLQVTRELANKHLYKMISSWCHVRGLRNIEKFFAGESEGEQGHANLLMDLLDDANIQIQIPELPKKPDVFTDCGEISRVYADAETETTDFLDALYALAEKQKNIGVSNLLQSLLQEQVEEMGLTERFGNLVRQANGDLLTLDLMFAQDT